MTVKMIVAVDRDNAIGHENGELPWKISEDLKRFKALTTGSSVLMGRKTFDSLKMPFGLPNRMNIVISSHDNVQKSNESVVYCSPNIGVAVFIREHQRCLGCEPPDLWVIGGASVYDQALSDGLVDEIYMTRVDANSGAEVRLKHDIFNWKSFVLSQRVLGINWGFEQLESFPESDTCPTFSFSKFTKESSK